MRILWVISQISPEVAGILGVTKNHFGGWVQAMIDKLREQPINLGVVACADINIIITRQINGVIYYIIPSLGKTKDVRKEDCAYVLNIFKPDLIHIQGTEFLISRAFSTFAEYKNLVSLQGILEGCEAFQYGALPLGEFMFSWNWTKIIVAWSLFLRKKHGYSRRLAAERTTLENAQNIVGRTLWDHAHSFFFNRSVHYYCCNETLRSTFYAKSWDYQTCEIHSVFIGNGYSALKGAHVAIEAIRLLLDVYPDLVLYIAGEPPYLKGKISLKKLVGYSLYLRQLLEDPVFNGHVKFTGSLDEEQMAERMCRSNVYVLSSLIENSPNTLGEAMIMGVPCISSYVGGVPVMASDEKEALFYRAGDARMLAWQIKRLFDMCENASEIGNAARRHAYITHNQQKNVQDLMEIYSCIVSGT